MMSPWPPVFWKSSSTGEWGGKCCEGEGSDWVGRGRPKGRQGHRCRLGGRWGGKFENNSTSLWCDILVGWLGELTPKMTSELPCGSTGLDFFSSATPLALFILRGPQCPFGSLVSEAYKECWLWDQTPPYLEPQGKKRPERTQQYSEQFRCWRQAAYVQIPTLAVWPWTNHSTSLCLSFLINKRVDK